MTLKPVKSHVIASWSLKVLSFQHSYIIALSKAFILNLLLQLLAVYLENILLYDIIKAITKCLRVNLHINSASHHSGEGLCSLGQHWEGIISSKVRSKGQMTNRSFTVSVYKLIFWNQVSVLTLIWISWCNSYLKCLFFVVEIHINVYLYR